MSSIFRWSEISRILTGDRTAIRSTYSGKKYAKIINEIKEDEKELLKKIQSYCNELKSL